MNYETKTFSSHWRIYCYTLVTLLAIGGRRYERLVGRKLIFRDFLVELCG